MLVSSKGSVKKTVCMNFAQSPLPQRIFETVGLDVSQPEVVHIQPVIIRPNLVIIKAPK